MFIGNVYYFQVAHWTPVGWVGRGEFGIVNTFGVKYKGICGEIFALFCDLSKMSIPSEFEAGVRKCLLRKWPEFRGYGFNLHAEKGKYGQFVGQVDAGSPALAAGLKAGDRIVEVNNESIGNENHQQVVSRVKESGDSVWLLVVDKETDEYCKNNGIDVSGENPSVKVLECPETIQQTHVKSSSEGMYFFIAPPYDIF